MNNYLNTRKLPRFKVRQMPRRKCAGWHEPSHPTVGPVVVFVHPDGRETPLCLCCAVDFRDDAVICEDDREITDMAISVAKVFA